MTASETAAPSRPRLRRALLLGVGAVVVLVAGYAVHVLRLAGQFSTIEPHFDGTCVEVEGVVGPEDLVVDPESGLALLSALDRRAAAEGRESGAGIYAYDLEAEGSTPVNLTPELPFAFHPHGLSLHRGPAGATLMVVNHRGGGDAFGSVDDTIEIFAWDGAALTHRETISDPGLRAMNDVHAVDERRFYATRDHHYTAGLMRKVEDYARLARSSVVYYDGERLQTVAEGFRYANGIHLDAAGDKLYVAATTDFAVSIFDRDPETGALSNRVEVEVGSGVDNIDIDAEGTLWIASHPKLFDFLAHAKDARKLSPSQVFSLAPNQGGGLDITEVYLDEGTQLSGSTTAVRVGDRLLIGAVFEPKFLDCRMAP